MANPYAVDGALYTKLAAGTALVAEIGSAKIYDSLAPLDIDLPYVTYHLQAGGDDNLTPVRSVDEVWTVKAVASTLAKAKAIAYQVDLLLHGQTLTVTGWTVFMCRRENKVSLTESEPTGGMVYHRGAQYRIRADVS